MVISFDGCQNIIISGMNKECTHLAISKMCTKTERNENKGYTKTTCKSSVGVVPLSMFFKQTTPQEVVQSSILKFTSENEGSAYNSIDESARLWDAANYVAFYTILLDT